MEYGRLGGSGLVLSRIVLGCSGFGELVDEAGAGAVLARAWDLGVTALDTGDVYAGGGSEAILGRLIGGRRHQITLATKVGFRVGDGEAEHLQALSGRSSDTLARWRAGVGPNEHGLSAKHIKEKLSRRASDG